MSERYFNLYVEINNSKFIFYGEEIDNQNNSKIKYKLDIPASGLEENKILTEDNFKNKNILKISLGKKKHYIIKII